MSQIQQSKNTCSHHSITYTSSPHAAQTKYKQPTQRQRINATKPKPNANLSDPPTRTDLDNFPAPLILPEDDLALNPEQPPQSFQKWHDMKTRNKVTPERRTIYILPPPGFDGGVDDDIHLWTLPRGYHTRQQLSTPSHEDTIAYLSAFYTGLAVKRLQIPNWNFHCWTEGRMPMRRQKFIGVTTKTKSTRIRMRKAPDGLYPFQLNLEDLLNVAINVLPADAFALCMLMDHDLYEDEEDTFTCGRAYGGRRVSVVSTARYNPLLDEEQFGEREHAWPASHCTEYIQSLCNLTEPTPKKKKTASKPSTSPEKHPDNITPLQLALTSFISCPPLSNSSPDSLLTILWLFRICRTTSHELGHCFGIAHCTYHACIMQGSASLAEDARQPPELCPVDLAKLLFATGESMRGRYTKLLEFCGRKGVCEGAGFAALGGWVRGSMRVLNGDEGGGADADED
ncbi:hypothetical protein BDV12DRAFT_209054 [Aspergillus spectabilis]